MATATEAAGLYQPGEVVNGFVEQASEGSVAELLCVEVTPQASFVRLVEQVQLPTGAAGFALRLPDDLPPSLLGGGCELGYAVRVHGRDPSRTLVAPIVVAARAPAVRCETRWRDRLLAWRGARRFHIELTDARLDGGGRIAGRVHRDGSGPDAPVVVRVRCLECWRVEGDGFVASRTGPWWGSRVLWEGRQAAGSLAGARWLPFSFDLPAGLPPAVEGYAVAWRYEVAATRRRRLATEEAVVTPVAFEAPAGRTVRAPLPG